MPKARLRHHTRQYRGVYTPKSIPVHLIMGDTVTDDLHSYGFKDVKVEGNSARLYIDDLMMSKSRVGTKCFGER